MLRPLGKSLETEKQTKELEMLTGQLSGQTQNRRRPVSRFQVSKVKERIYFCVNGE